MKKFNTLMILLLLMASTFMFAQKNTDSKYSVKPGAEKNARVLPSEDSPHFMQFGIRSRNHEEFRKKYGIAVIYQNCVISQFLFQKARENNQLVAKNLTEKFGDYWRKDLGFIPFGL